MSLRAISKNLAWYRLPVGSVLAAPPIPGVYAYGAVEAVHGLPVRLDWAYVGQARNLAARLTQHDPTREPHPGLRQWLVAHAGTGEVWYAPMDAQYLNGVERHLIRHLRPRLNRRLYLTEGTPS